MIFGYHQYATSISIFLNTIIPNIAKYEDRNIPSRTSTNANKIEEANQQLPQYAKVLLWPNDVANVLIPDFLSGPISGMAENVCIAIAHKLPPPIASKGGIEPETTMYPTIPGNIYNIF